MKTFYAAMLLLLGLFVALGIGLFVKGASEHFNRPLVSLDDSGVQARVNDVSPRADGDVFYALG